MKILRTPDERFTDLPGWPHEPRYAEVTDGLRVAYVDVGPADADPVLLLHGEPTWGFLYRQVVEVLVDAGHRCVVPDLVGFGRSDKPADDQPHVTVNGAGHFLQEDAGPELGRILVELIERTR